MRTALELNAIYLFHACEHESCRALSGHRWHPPTGPGGPTEAPAAAACYLPGMRQSYIALALALALAACPTSHGPGDAGSSSTTPDGGTVPSHLKTVFLIVMENHNWSDIHGSDRAPYLNQTLLPMGAHAENYFNPPGNHPSEPNYLWLEAGTNFGVHTDDDPIINHQASTAHLATLLNAAGISWRSYQEDISGTVCPLTAVANYRPKHNPFVFFDDLTGHLNPQNAACIAHNRPLTELASDLAQGGRGVAQYNFITPNLCHDGHNSCAPENDEVKQTDDWLAANIPMILASEAYRDGGVIFITWDESEGGDFPIGMIALSPLAKAGYSSNVAWTHSSTLRSMEEILGVTPFLGDAANATDLSDLFTKFP